MCTNLWEATCEFFLAAALLYFEIKVANVAITSSRKEFLKWPPIDFCVVALVSMNSIAFDTLVTLQTRKLSNTFAPQPCYNKQYTVS